MTVMAQGFDDNAARLIWGFAAEFVLDLCTEYSTQMTANLRAQPKGI
jgi:hypothetical protein